MVRSEARRKETIRFFNAIRDLVALREGERVPARIIKPLRRFLETDGMSDAVDALEEQSNTALFPEGPEPLIENTLGVMGRVIAEESLFHPGLAKELGIKARKRRQESARDARYTLAKN